MKTFFAFLCAINVGVWASGHLVILTSTLATFTGFMAIFVAIDELRDAAKS